jgi:hypothetical protein
MLKDPIRNLELSNRAFNALESIGIHTIEQLINTKETDLMKVKNLGELTLKEIKDSLTKWGMFLNAPKETQEERMRTERIRDQFAGMAMQGIIMDGSLNMAMLRDKKHVEDETAEYAYGFANAMIQARARNMLRK